MIEDPYKLICKDQVIADGAIRFQKHYNRLPYHGTEHWQKAQQIAALKPEEMTADKLNEIIGNSTWTDNKCEVCDGDNEVILQLGEEPDYESHTINICQGCLEDALQFMKGKDDGKA